MTPALLVQFEPSGPWRISGGGAGVERVFHSDTLYAALTVAMDQLGLLSEWLPATAEAERPLIAVSSLFPYQEQTLYVTPPATVWPPAPSARTYWSGAKFAPMSVIRPLLDEESLEEDRWTVDLPSECLINQHRHGRVGGPFVVSQRRSAAVDRLTGQIGVAETVTCLEFREGCGMWGAVTFADESVAANWAMRLKGAFRLLADTGLGGERSRGFGGASKVEFKEGDLGELLLPPRKKASSEEPAVDTRGTGYWLLSLFSPSATETIDWNHGFYRLATRSGRTGAELTKRVRLVTEGSVLVSGEPLRGSAKNVAPDGHAHAVYRSGLAVALPVPIRLTGDRASERTVSA